MQTLRLILCLVLAVPASSAAQTVETYRFGLFAEATTVTETSAPLWETTWAATAATCNLADPGGTATPIVIAGGVHVAYGDPTIAGRSCVSPLVTPVVPACTTATCPRYKGYLKASNSSGSAPWTLAAPLLTTTAAVPPPPPPPPPSPSPDKTRVPPSPSLVDASGGVWTIAAGANNILRNGLSTSGQGTILTWCGAAVRAFGTDASWYRWTGAWTPEGAVDACAATPPPPPPPVVNCVVSAWSPVAWSAWTAASPTTETRTGTQTRTVTTPASGGGTACPVLTQVTTETRQIAPTTGQECVAPLGVEAVSVFITRWEPISGKVPRPGAEARINYKLASKSPIRSIAVKVNGAVVRQQAGTDVDLSGDGGMWFTVPATAGSYKLSVAVTNVACPTPREVLAPVDLVVR